MQAESTQALASAQTNPFISPIRLSIAILAQEKASCIYIWGFVKLGGLSETFFINDCNLQEILKKLKRKVKIPILMQDVADAAGISLTTVSHVLNDTRPVAPGTRARVLEAVEKLGYFRNASARLLARGYSDAMGLVVSDIENPFFPQLIKGFELACHEEQLEAIIATTHYNHDNAERIVRFMVENKVRGVAIMTSQFDSKLVDRLLGHNIAVVRLDDDKLKINQSSVRIDYTEGVSEAVSHLASAGHKNVAILHGPLQTLSTARYSKGLERCINAHDMRVVGRIATDSNPGGGASGAKLILEKNPKPTAILCGNDLLAIGAMGQALKSGWKIPDDLSIIGADDISFAAYSHPPLSTVRVFRDEIGQCAFQLLHKMVANLGERGIEIAVRTKFILRESSGQLKLHKDEGSRAAQRQ